MENRAWWRRYFGEDFFQLHIDLFPEELSRREVAAMIDYTGLPAGSTILDVPCGWGRHAQLLQQAGFIVYGADLSPALLDHAHRGRGDPHYCAADIRQLPFANASFDAAFNVFTSLGLFLDDAEDLAALREIHRTLR